MKRIVHRQTGIRFSIEQDLNGEMRLFVDLQGNSITSTPLKKKEMLSFLKFLDKVGSVICDEIEKLEWK